MDVTEWSIEEIGIELGGGTAQTPATYPFTAVNGRLEADDGDPTVITMTPSGLFIGDNGPDAGGFMGMAEPATETSLTDFFGSDREFLGVMYTKGSGFTPSEAQQRIMPAWGKITAGDNRILGGFYSVPHGDFTEATKDVASAQFVPETLAVDSKMVFEGYIANYTPPAAPLTAAITSPDMKGTGAHFTYIIRQVEGKYLVIGFDTGFNSTPLSFRYFIAVEQ